MVIHGFVLTLIYSDQLARIFLVVGSPPDTLVKRLPCQVHIRGWPHAPRKLERTVQKMMTPERFYRTEADGDSADSAESDLRMEVEMDHSTKCWAEVIGGLLELEPRHRWTCSRAQDVIKQTLRDNVRAADKRNISSSDMLSNSSTSPTSTAPQGPKAPSPSNRSRHTQSNHDSSPINISSPERDLPGRQIPSFYSQLRVQKDYMRPFGEGSNTSRAHRACQREHKPISSREQTMSNVLTEKRNTLSLRRRHRQDIAPGTLRPEFGRTRSRSHSPVAGVRNMEVASATKDPALGSLLRRPPAGAPSAAVNACRSHSQAGVSSSRMRRTGSTEAPNRQ